MGTAAHRRIAIGFLGFGTVGNAVYDLLTARPLPGCVVKRICVANPEKDHERRLGSCKEILTADWSDVLRDPEIEIVVEAIGVPREGKTLADLSRAVQAALRAGKSLVTANKQLMAEHWREMITIASEHSASLGFEACVGGGVPIIEPMRARQELEEVLEIVGILNATSNFVLTRRAEGKSTEEALALAEKYELAEKGSHSNPEGSTDLDGTDAAFKIAILASLAFRTVIHPERIAWKEGLVDLGSDVFDFAQEFGYEVKPIAVARVAEGSFLEIGVYPALLPRNHPLASAHGDFNAVLVKGEFSGWHMFSGKGAGASPTATAVYNDLARVVRQTRAGTSDAPIDVSKSWRLLPKRRITRRGYFHAVAPDEPGNLTRISRELARQKINVRQFDQINTINDSSEGTPFMLSTDRIDFAAVEAALRRIARLQGFGRVQYLPIEDWETPGQPLPSLDGQGPIQRLVAAVRNLGRSSAPNRI